MKLKDLFNQVKKTNEVLRSVGASKSLEIVFESDYTMVHAFTYEDFKKWLNEEYFDYYVNSILNYTKYTITNEANYVLSVFNPYLNETYLKKFTIYIQER